MEKCTVCGADLVSGKCPACDAKTEKKTESESIRTIKVGIQYREVIIEKRQIDEKKRTIDLSFSSEEPVDRFWGTEILDHQSKSVNLRRLKKAGALLIDHDMRNQVGVIEEVSIDEADRKGRASVRFGRSAKAEEIFQDVLDGIRSNVSVGYQIDEVVLEKEVKDGPSIYRVMHWEPYEISIVSVPGDVTVGVGRSDDQGKEIAIRIPPPTPPQQKEKAEPQPKKEERKMEKCAKCQADLVDGKCPACEAQRQIAEASKKTGVEIEKERIEVIRMMCKMNSLDEQYVDHFIGTGMNPKAVGDEILKIKEEREKNSPLTKIGLGHDETKRFSITRAIRAIVDKDWGKIAPFELECSQAVAQRLGKTVDPHRFFIPFEVLERPMPEIITERDLRALHGGFGRRDVSVAAQGGSYLVQTTNLSFIEMLRNRSVALRMGATRMTGLVGNVTIPKQSAAATAYWLSAETTQITESQQTFVQVSLSPHNVGAYTEISRQLLLQSSPAAEGIVSNDLATVVALAVDIGVLRGSNAAGQPQGIVGASGVSTDVSGTSLAFAGILQCQSELADSNVIPMRGGYVTTATVAADLMATMKVTNDYSPLWEGGLWDGMMCGFPAMSSSQMATATLLFGDWSSVVVGEWGVLEVEVNPYANFQAGIIGIRAIHSMDVALRHGAAFVYVSSIT